MVRNTLLLPTGYYELIKVDLQKDKKLALFINVGSLLILAAMVVPTAIICPPLDFTSIMENPNGFQNDLFTFLLRWLPLLGGMIVYFVLHELTHGICMKAFTKTKVKYGYTGLYFFAGSEAYFNKKSYIIIALAPVVLLGVVLLVLNLLCGVSWFWTIYLIQAMNISGSIGDLYVTVKFLRLPPDILIQDTGVSMTVYSKRK